MLGLAGLLGAVRELLAAAPGAMGRRSAVGRRAGAGRAVAGGADRACSRSTSDAGDPIPAYWSRGWRRPRRARAPTTRVLELPGSNFAAYRWGNTVDPILPGLMSRPQLSREVLPQGSPSSVLLLDALDRRLQEGMLEPSLPRAGRAPARRR